MKSLIKLELLRAKQVYNKRLLFFLGVSLILILSLFFFVLKTGGLYTNVFYTYYTDNPQIKQLMKQHPKFLFADIHSDLYFLIGQRINLIPSGFSGYAASASAYAFFQDYNRFVWEQENISPFVYLSLQERNQSFNDSHILPSKEVSEQSSQQFQDDIRHGEQQENVSAQEQSSLGDQLQQSLQSLEKTPSLSNLPKNAEQTETNAQAQISLSETPPSRSSYQIHKGFQQEKKSIQQRLTEEIKKTTKTYNELLTPEDLEPRMPFDQIYLSLSFIVVLTFLSLMFTNRIMDEKVNKKGLLLFVAPLKRYEIILGKVIPYAVAAFALSLFILLPFQPNLYEFFSFCIVIVSIIFAYLGLSFFIGAVSRSFKELSFLGIFSISLYSLFLLIPVFLLHFSSASYASPLTPLVQILLHEPVSFGLLLFSALPHLVFAWVLFYTGYHLMNPEDFFAVKPLWKKIMDVYTVSLKTWPQSIIAGFNSVFFVYFLELLAIVVFLTIQRKYFLVFILATSAFIEELIRNLPLVVLVQKKKLWKERLLHAALVAFGFFLAEKLLLLLSIAPFTETLSLLQFSTLLFPWIMHTLLSFLFMGSYVLGKKVPFRFWLSIGFTTLLHFATNYYLFQFLHLP